LRSIREFHNVNSILTRERGQSVECLPVEGVGDTRPRGLQHFIAARFLQASRAIPKQIIAKFNGTLISPSSRFNPCLIGCPPTFVISFPLGLQGSIYRREKPDGREKEGGVSFKERRIDSGKTSVQSTIRTIHMRRKTYEKEILLQDRFGVGIGVRLADGKRIGICETLEIWRHE
jgi:hypothetical protein